VDVPIEIDAKISFLFEFLLFGEEPARIGGGFLETKVTRSTAAAAALGGETHLSTFV
jgi:hypothetical protein